MGRQSAAIGDRLRRETANIVKFITLGIDAKLRQHTPVGTGHARANWVPSVGTPFGDEVEGASESAHDAGVAIVREYKIGDGPAFVTNNVPYILELNDGSSTKEPAGFIERAIDEALAETRDKFGSAIDVTTNVTGGGQ